MGYCKRTCPRIAKMEPLTNVALTNIASSWARGSRRLGDAGKRVEQTEVNSIVLRLARPVAAPEHGETPDVLATAACCRHRRGIR
jgi:hypothetical protein